MNRFKVCKSSYIWTVPVNVMLERKCLKKEKKNMFNLKKAKISRMWPKALYSYEHTYGTVP